MSQSHSNINSVVTKDGSHTLFSKRFEEHYHSSFGAVQESNHIFIQAALRQVSNSIKSINLFEVGFGTGLNALLAYKYALSHELNINYFSVEAYPIEIQVVKVLNYPAMLNISREIFVKMHSEKNVKISISEQFNLTVYKSTFQELVLPEDTFDVVFFDAFSPESQPEMWSEHGFRHIFRSMKTGGVLTTYSSKGIVKRALKAVGFNIEKLPGPPGKREFVRAIK